MCVVSVGGGRRQCVSFRSAGIADDRELAPVIGVHGGTILAHCRWRSGAGA